MINSFPAVCQIGRQEEQVTFAHLAGTVQLSSPFSLPNDQFIPEVLLQVSFNYWVVGHVVWENDSRFYHLSPPFFRLFLFFNHGAEVEVAGKIVHLNPGVFYLLPPTLPFQVTYAKGAELFYIHLDSPEVSIGVNPGSLNQIYSCDAGLIADYFRFLHVNCMFMELQVLISSVVLRLLPKEVKQQIVMHDTLLLQFPGLKQILDSRPPADIRINQIAEVMKVSPEHFSRKFQKVFGCSIKAFLHQYTMSAAKRLLLSTSLPINEISLKLGFKDHHYFYSYFQKFERQTPQEFRKSRACKRHYK